MALYNGGGSGFGGGMGAQGPTNDGPGPLGGMASFGAGGGGGGGGAQNIGFSGGAPGFGGGNFGQQPSRAALDRAEAQCAGGDGYACQLAQRLRRDYQEAVSKYNQNIQLQSVPAGGGSMGVNGRGGGSPSRGPSWQAAMMQNMYGVGGGGFGGMG